MKRKYKDERGAIALDAILGLTVFMGVVFSLMFITLIVRVQTTMQFALNQTAKEIAGYFYLLDKVGVTKVISGPDKSKAKDVDTMIGYVLDFSDQTVEIGEQVSHINIDNVTVDPVGELSALNEVNIDGYLNTANNMVSSLETVGSDLKGNLLAVLSIFAKSMANRAVSYYVTPYVCRAIMPKYISGDRKATDETLKKMGIEQGLAEIDFTQSQLLLDGRSVKLVAMYKLNAKNVTFGLVDKDLYFRVAASTAAWVAPDSANTHKLSELPSVKSAASGEGEGEGEGAGAGGAGDE